MKVHRLDSSPTTRPERRRLRKRLRIALATAGITQAKFADRRCRVTAEHFSMYLNGHRDSTVLDAAIRSFIAEQLGQEPLNDVA